VADRGGLATAAVLAGGGVAGRERADGEQGGEAGGEPPESVCVHEVLLGRGGRRVRRWRRRGAAPRTGSRAGAARSSRGASGPRTPCGTARGPGGSGRPSR